MVVSHCLTDCEVRGADPGRVAQSNHNKFRRKEPSQAPRLTITRTVWLPRPIDSSGVKAKLEDGELTLTLTVPKAVEQGSTRINVE